jgi:hypothetical protein
LDKLTDLSTENGKRSEKSSPEGSLEEKVVDVGLDISTSVVGVCVVDHYTNELVMLDAIKLNKTGCDSLWEKADCYRKQLLSYKAEQLKGMKINKVFVEANAKMFAQGRTSANTILTLAKFNGICSYIIRDLYGVDVVDVNVVSARSKLGLKIDRTDKTKSTKQKVREQVLLKFPTLPLNTHIAKTGKNKGEEVLDKDMEDRIDAFVIVLGGKIIDA